MPREDLIQYRRDTAANWASVNPVLEDGEPGVDQTNHQIRIGDGVSNWVDLPVSSDDSALAQQAIEDAAAAAEVANTTAAVVDDGRLSEPTLNATIGAVALLTPNTFYRGQVVFDGDSITIGSQTDGAAGQDRRGSWTTNFAARAMGRVHYLFNAAVAGQRSDQMLGRFDTYVAPRAPQTIIATIGTNDIAQSISMSVWLANLDAYLAKCVGIGARLIFGEIWPTTNNVPAGRPATTRAWNEALHTWADDNDVLVIPWQRLADPATGGWPSTWTSDTIHPGQIDSYDAIAEFGWNFLEPYWGGQVVRRASVTGADLAANGFGTTVDAGKTSPGSIVATPSTASGTLTADTYSYKLTSLTYYGESLASAGTSAVLSGTGKVDLSWAAVSGSRGYRIYRKPSAGSTWQLVGTVEGGATTTFSDNAPGTPGALPPTVDTSFTPSGLTVGSATRHTPGEWLFTEPGVRGKILRFRPYVTGTAGTSDYYEILVTPGTVIDFSCLMRAVTGTTAQAKLYLRFRSDSAEVAGLSIFRDVLNTTQFGLVSARSVAPAGTTRVRISFEIDYQATYMDIAEIRLAAV